MQVRLHRPWTGPLVGVLQPLTGVVPRRIVEALPGRSPRALLHRAVSDARSPQWSLLAPARRLEDQAHGDARLLRAARQRLRSAAPNGLSHWQSRALVSLSIAINELELDLGASSVNPLEAGARGG
jgi:hypothetical protein